VAMWTSKPKTTSPGPCSRYACARRAVLPPRVVLTRQSRCARQALAQAAVHSTAGTFTNAVTAAEALRPELLAALDAGEGGELNDIKQLLGSFESSKVGVFTKMGLGKSETSHKQRVDEVVKELALGRCGKGQGWSAVFSYLG
jgi:hypothetical protein